MSEYKQYNFVIPFSTEEFVKEARDIIRAKTGYKGFVEEAKEARA